MPTGIGYNLSLSPSSFGVNAVGINISGGVLYTFTLTVSKAKHPSIVETLTT